MANDKLKMTNCHTCESRYPAKETVFSKTGFRVKHGMTLVIILFCFLLMSFNLCFASVASDKAEKVIKQFVLSGHPEWRDENIIINLNESIDKLDKLDNSASLAIPEAFRLTKIPRKILMPLIISTPGQSSRVIEVWVKVEVYKDIITAKYKITKNSLFSSDMFNLIKRDVAMLPATFFTNESDLIGKAAKTNISEGSIIYSWMVKAPAIISKGSNIRISVAAEGLLVEADGIALEDGQIGDKINVRRTDSGKVFSAIVTGSNNVEVKL